MTAGVAGRMDRAKRPCPQVEIGAVDQPVVGVLPVDDRGAVAVHRGQIGGQLRRAHPAQAVDAEKPARAGAVDQFPGRDHVRALFLAQRDHAVKRAPQLYRQGVVVDVNVGDEEVADVAELVSDLPQPRGEPLPGRDQRDPGVDQVDSAVVGDRVDVDRLQPVYRQRQGDPVYASA